MRFKILEIFSLVPLLLILGMFAAGCATYDRKAIVKRDRYGESPVVDMRSGQSYLEQDAAQEEEAAKKARRKSQAALAE